MKFMGMLMSLLMVWACTKPEPLPLTPPEVPVEDTSKLEFVWQIPLIVNENFNYAYSHQPVVYKENVLMSNTSDNGSLWMLNGETGDIVWKWNSFMGSPAVRIDLNNNIYENKFVYTTGPEVGVLNLDNGSLEWQFKTANSVADPRIALIGDEVYHKWVPNEVGVSYVQLTKTNISNIDWQPVLTLYQDSMDGYSPSIEGPSLWMSPQGDSVLVFQNRSWHFDEGDGKIDFYAYNTSTKSIEFILEDIEPNGNSNVMPPLVDGDRAYMLGGRQLHCIDLVNGKMKWQQQFLGRFHHVMISNAVIRNDNIIVKADDGAIHCYNKYNGDVVWKIDEGAGSDPSDMVLANGIAYYTASGVLYAIDVDRGEILWKEESPHKSGKFNNGVGVNTDLGYVYVQDQQYIMCIKVPEKLK